MINVKEITQKGIIHDNSFSSVPVTEAKLVLIKIAYNSVSKESAIPGHTPILADSVTQIKPILISETEKIEEGDMGYHPQFGIRKCVSIRASYKDDEVAPGSPNFKILALPEHFSHQQLKDIVEGKLKDGDKLLVECEHERVYSEYNRNFSAGKDIHRIKSPLSLYPIEEKLYNGDIFIEALWKYSQFCRDMDIDPDYSAAKKWFEQNIK